MRSEAMLGAPMGSAKNVLSVLLTVCLPAIGLGAEEPFQPDPDVVAQVESILAKFESSLATRGAGTAVATRQVPQQDKPQPRVTTYHHRFQFTPSSSRADVYELKAPDKSAGRRRNTYVRVAESLFQVHWTSSLNPNNAMVHTYPSDNQWAYWHRRTDFDTQVLLAYAGRVSTDAIRGQLATAPCTVAKDDSGMAIVRFEFPSGGFSQYKFDTNAGHTLIESQVDTVFPDGDGLDSLRSSSKIEYAKAEGAWYPKHIHSERTETQTQPDSSVLSWKGFTTVEITAFDPSAAISDSDFTLAGVGVSKGAQVYDAAADIDYLYGATQELARDFSDVLDEIEPDLTPEAIEPEDNADVVASPAVPAPEDHSARPSQNLIEQTTDDAAHTGLASHRLMAAAVVAAIAIIVFVVLRRQNN